MEQITETLSLVDESWTHTWQVDRLVALCKEPNTIFVYWEVQAIRKRLLCEHFQTDWESLPFYLQVYNVTQVDFDGWNVTPRRIPVHPRSDNWYIHELEPGRRYLVDFGTVTWEGSFFTILRSNVLETPPSFAQHNTQTSIRFAPPRLRPTTRDQLAADSTARPIAPLKGSEPLLASSRSVHSLLDRWHPPFNGYSVADRKEGDF